MDARRLLRSDINQYKALLIEAGLKDDCPSEAYGIFDEDRLVGAGGRDGNVLKGFAISPSYRGEGLLSSIVGPLLDDLGQEALVFTSPASMQAFQSLGFLLLGSTDQAALLTSRPHEYRRFIDTIKAQGAKAAVVANANPFTKGHLYLITQAIKAEGRVLVLIVQADRSAYPFFLRLEMARRALKGLDAIVMPSGPYIISQATFPTYFIKDDSLASKAYADLDAAVYSRIAHDAGIQMRYVGTEPFDKLTEYYNQALCARAAVTVIPRLGQISASSYRKTQDPELVPSVNLGLLDLARKGKDKAGILGALAREALEKEVMLTPKPGLVDQANNGSHTDMDLELFMKSAKALQGYFEQCARMGEDYDGTFPAKLREAGIQAEEVMLKATGGVNTHKGAIFSMGILCYCLAQEPFGNPSQRIKLMCSSLQPRRGAVDMARTGYSLVFQALSLSPLRALAFFMAGLDDANILRRGGEDSLAWTQKQASSMLHLPEQDLKQAMENLDQGMMKAGLSPGGSADMMGLYYLLKSLEA